LGKRKGQSWVFEELPNVPRAAGKEYQFFVGQLDYIDKGKTYLHITEHPNRSAEGRPLYPEQEAWVREIIKKHRINATEIWHSTWEFKTNSDAVKFINVLDGIGV
jgi:hypothetical protein